VSGVISDGGYGGGAGGALVKVGTGTLTLSGAHTYTGATTGGAGTLRTGSADALASTAAVVVASGGALDLDSRSQTVAALTNNGAVNLGDASTTLTVTGDYAGGGSLVVSGALSGIGPNGILSVAGHISGVTTLTFVNPSGAPANCDEIPLVTGAPSGAFVLSGGANARVHVGSCQYTVAQEAGALSLVNAPIAITTAASVPALNEAALALLALLRAGGAAARGRRGCR
jgi:autotransporter-associated beta strand protein